MRPRSIHSTWVYDREAGRCELVRVLIDGQEIDLERVVVAPGSGFEFSILAELPSRQGELFGGEK